MLKFWVSAGRGRAAGGVKGLMLRSIRIGMRVNGNAAWAESCLSVLKDCQ